MPVRIANVEYEMCLRRTRSRITRMSSLRGFPIFEENEIPKLVIFKLQTFYKSLL
jgi:hypothetical protein